MRTQAALSQASDLAASAQQIGRFTVVRSSVGPMPSADALRSLALEVRDRLGNEHNVVVALAGAVDGKPSLVVATNDGARQLDISAGALVKAVGKYLGGGGGGRPDVAQGGGTKLEGIKEALEALHREISSK